MDADLSPTATALSAESLTQMNDGDVMTFLVATDNHLGFMEKDVERGRDSFLAFEEVLRIATEKRVDAILLAGDLFHENKPSMHALYQAMAMLRRTCFNDRKCALELISDPTRHFHGAFPIANYQDPHFNVGMPIFTIHGNHDEPGGDHGLSAVDLLSVSGFVNHFGRIPDLEAVTLSPLLLRKGRTKLALYGMSNVRDERLHRLFRHQKVEIQRPEADPNWFNVLMLHQNRAAHTPKGHLPESFIDSVFDLLIWGHEHECRIKPEFNEQGEFYVTQPGSSVATSLSVGESQKKHVGILSIHGKRFHLEHVPLKSVRPFIMEEVTLTDVDSLRPSHPQDVVDYLKQKVEDLIVKVSEQWRQEHGDEEMPKPLIRIRVEYTGFDTVNPQRFGLGFVDKVANPRELLQFHRKKVMPKKTSGSAPSAGVAPHMPPVLDAVRVEDLVDELLNKQDMGIFPVSEFTSAIRTYVEREDLSSIKDFWSKNVVKVQGQLLERVKHLDEDAIVREAGLLAKVTEQRLRDEKLISPARPAPAPMVAPVVKEPVAVELSDGDDVGMKSSQEEVVARPFQAVKAKPAPRKRTRVVLQESDDEGNFAVPDDDIEPTPTATVAKRGRGAAKTTTRKPAASRAKPTQTTLSNLIGSRRSQRPSQTVFLDDDTQPDPPQLTQNQTSRNPFGSWR